MSSFASAPVHGPFQYFRDRLAHHDAKSAGLKEICGHRKRFNTSLEARLDEAKSYWKENCDKRGRLPFSHAELVKERESAYRETLDLRARAPDFES